MIISNYSSIEQGETALLACVGEGFPLLEISWMHNGQTVVNSSLVSITEEDMTQGERMFKQSFLQICSVTLRDAGDYICGVSNGENSVTSSTQLTVTGMETNS